MQLYMQEMIDERRNAEKRPERPDLFSNLLDANMEEEEGKETRLADSELIGTLDTFGLCSMVLTTCRISLGDIFVFLLAGHEVSLFSPPPLISSISYSYAV